MKVLIGCEYSGRVRDAFIAKGHDAISADILPTERPGPHYQGDVRDILKDEFDLAIFHPPCTFLANSGAKHLYKGARKVNGPNPERWQKMREGAAFFLDLWNCNIPRVAVENPVMLGYAMEIIGCGPTQTIQPWQFGHTEVKRTCLWLRNLPRLIETKNVRNETLKLPYSERAKVHHAPPSKDRWKDRSRTLDGIAHAMATQWGGDLIAP